ncbi:MAG: amidophosphoribosyltransferase [Candidatus Melainabacteria bacterium]|nr:MAG: amidophosphoribosyltransferase [Candidatus Melainabacteria bacterium]
MCGLVAISGTSSSAYEAFFGLMNLQHRGQDGAGILSISPKNGNGFHLQRGSGLIENVFSERTFKSLVGNAALAHTRYSTVGHNDPNLLQPFLDFQVGIGLAHNGNIVNFYSLREQIQDESGGKLAIESDSALILHLLAKELKGKEINSTNVFAAIESCANQLVGSYSVACLTKTGDIFGFRDPYGVRPLVFGKKQTTQSPVVYGLASETIALNFLGFESLEDILPGEAIYIAADGTVTRKLLKQEGFAPCMFEWVYFARVESVFDNKSVYQVRFRLGQVLAKQLRELGVKADVVIPVPETSRVAAIALAESLGIPFRELLIKNRYINRTFILDDQASRQEAVRRKLFPIGEELDGKSCLIVDDSIVRGNTARQIVKLVRQAGAGEVTIVSTCPAIINPCYYGIDFPSPNELVAHERSDQEIATTLGADRVVYQTLEGLMEAIGTNRLCLGCLTGKYPTSVTNGNEFESMRLKDRAAHATKNKCG